jgi:sugar/nucleoside kinase (ribokinase family)
MSVDVVGVGASCVDHVCRLPVFPEAGGARAKVRMQSQTRSCGGQIATALATCSSLGLRAAYLGVVGDDDDGRRIRRELSARGIIVDHVKVGVSPTATATILLDPSGDRIVLWHREPALCYPPGELPSDLIASARVVHVDDVDEPAALAAAKLARSRGIPVTCDIDHITDATAELLRHISHPVFAESVPLELTGETDPGRALRQLRLRHPGRLVVTLGERGAMALEGDTLLAVPAFRVRVVDSTGAGDVFRGAYIRALVDDRPAAAAIRFANAAAAVSCTKPGAMGGVPSLPEVEALLTRGA